MIITFIDIELSYFPVCITGLVSYKIVVLICYVFVTDLTHYFYKDNSPSLMWCYYISQLVLPG